MRQGRHCECAPRAQPVYYRDVMQTTPYRPIRALQRGLLVLEALNLAGRARPSALAQATGLDRTTVYRILATLQEQGMVTASESDDSYVLTARVRQLSDGFTDQDAVTRVVAPALGRLLQQVLWPSDYATFVDGRMVIQETSHRYSAFSIHRQMVGRARPVLGSALGRAVLAASTPAARETLLDVIRARNPEEAPDARRPEVINRLLEDFEKVGYAWSIGGTEARISAIALPVQVGDRVFGAVNVVFFRSALTVDEAARRYLPALRRTIEDIGAQLADLSPLTSAGAPQDASSAAPEAVPRVSQGLPEAQTREQSA